MYKPLIWGVQCIIDLNVQAPNMGSIIKWTSKLWTMTNDCGKLTIDYNSDNDKIN